MITLSFILLVFDTIYYNYNLHINTEGCNEFVWDSQSGLPLVEEHLQSLQYTLIVVNYNQYVYYKNSYTEDRIFFDYFHAKEVRQKTTLYDESVFPGLNASYVHNEPYVD